MFVSLESFFTKYNSPELIENIKTQFIEIYSFYNQNQSISNIKLNEFLLYVKVNHIYIYIYPTMEVKGFVSLHYEKHLIGNQSTCYISSLYLNPKNTYDEQNLELVLLDNCINLSKNNNCSELYYIAPVSEYGKLSEMGFDKHKVNGLMYMNLNDIKIND